MTAAAEGASSGRLRLERDRRVVPRVLARLVVVATLLASAVALLRDEGLPVLAGAAPYLRRPVPLLLALLHAGAGTALLAPPLRRFGAAGAAALLLGWTAFMGAGGDRGPAVVTGLLLILALRAAAPEDEGPWRPSRRPALATAGSLLWTLALGLFGRWLLGPWLFPALAPAGALLHRRALRPFGEPPRTRRLVVAWAGVWAAVSGVWLLLSILRG